MPHVSRSMRRPKAINFDLRTSSLRSRFGEAGRTEAYRKINRYLLERGFEHRQGSGYRSTGELSDLEMTHLVSLMYRDMDWLLDAVRRLDVTNIGRDYDMDSIVREGLGDVQP